jgi:hypothetical protein
VGAILHRDDPGGGSWSVEISSDGGSIGAVTTFAGGVSAVIGSGLDLWAADDQGQIWQRSPAGSWQRVVALPSFSATSMVEGSDAGTPELWVVGIAGSGQKNNVYSVSLPTLAYDGGIVGGATEQLSAIEASPQRVVAVSQLSGAVFFLFQGNNVAQTTTGVALHSVWSDRSSTGATAYAVGAMGAIYSGQEVMPASWVNNPFSGYRGTFWSAWGPTPTDLWLVGDLGEVIHYPGAQTIPVGTSNALHAVGGPPNGTERWLVGDYGTILHHP